MIRMLEFIGLMLALTVSPTMARNFQQPDAHLKLTAEALAGWVSDPEARKKYVEAFRRSDFEAMLNYYPFSRPALHGPALAARRIIPPAVDAGVPDDTR